MSTTSRITETTEVQREPGLKRRVFSQKTTQIILLFFGVLETLIALRFMLKLIGANPETPIVALIYSFSALFLIPFVGFLNSPTFGRIVLEIYSLFAIFIYALIALGFEKLTWVLFSRSYGSGTKRSNTADNKQDTQ
jgi:hypothetical protein